ncbi:DUF1799 domain-containing protein [Bradyrhizobium sp. LA2.1]|uniref:DUF1799 domain-containing protein n=1 Tax=Bradyrhizobium sp. LA2.1 TaxID=3156376 RepID=UPI003390FFC9
MDAASLAVLREALDADTAGPDAGDEFEGIWPENVAIVEAFLAVCTQWRVAPSSAGGLISPAGGGIAPTVSVAIGLDYTAVKVGLDAESIEVTPALWRGLRVMETAACNALNEDLS